MIILRQKEFGVLGKMNQWLTKKFNPKTETSEEIIPATSKEIKSSIIYKLFPTIDTSDTDFVDSGKLKSFKTSGLKDKNSLIKCLENIIWRYEEDNSEYTGVSEKDIKGNIRVDLLDEVVDNETIILCISPRFGSPLSKKLPDFLWYVEINLRTGEGNVNFVED